MHNKTRAKRTSGAQDEQVSTKRIAAFHMQRLGNYTICLSEQTFLATIFVINVHMYLSIIHSTTLT